MPRKYSKQISLSIEGKPASYKAIAKDRGGEVWKSYIENNPGCKQDIKDYLSQQLGEYLDASEIRRLTGITAQDLTRWQKEGSLIGIKLKGKWYYSKTSLAKAINAK